MSTLIVERGAAGDLAALRWGRLRLPALDVQEAPPVVAAIAPGHRAAPVDVRLRDRRDLADGLLQHEARPPTILPGADAEAVKQARDLAKNQWAISGAVLKDDSPARPLGFRCSRLPPPM